MSDRLFTACLLGLVLIFCSPRIIEMVNAPRIAQIQAEERVRLVEAVLGHSGIISRR